jgi:hypothetical protein
MVSVGGIRRREADSSPAGVSSSDTARLPASDTAAPRRPRLGWIAGKDWLGTIDGRDRDMLKREACLPRAAFLPLGANYTRVDSRSSMAVEYTDMISV